MYFRESYIYLPIVKDLLLFVLFIVSVLTIEKNSINKVFWIVLLYFLSIFIIGICDFVSFQGLLISFREYLIIPLFTYFIGIKFSNYKINSRLIDNKLNYILGSLSFMYVSFSLLVLEIFSSNRLGSYLNDQHVPGIITSMYVCSYFSRIKEAHSSKIVRFSTNIFAIVAFLYSLRTGSRIVIVIYAVIALLSLIRLIPKSLIASKRAVYIWLLAIVVSIFLLSYAGVTWELLASGRKFDANIATQNYYDWAYH